MKRKTKYYKATGNYYSTNAKVVISILLLLVTTITVLIVTNYAFDPETHHYPTLPFAAIASPTATLCTFMLFWQQNQSTRYFKSILLFFMTVIYIEVNSELSNHPTDNKSVKIIYTLFIGSLALNSVLYALSYFNANSSGTHTNIEPAEQTDPA